MKNEIESNLFCIIRDFFLKKLSKQLVRSSFVKYILIWVYVTYSQPSQMIQKLRQLLDWYWFKDCSSQQTLLNFYQILFYFLWKPSKFKELHISNIFCNKEITKIDMSCFVRNLLSIIPLQIYFTVKVMNNKEN